MYYIKEISENVIYVGASDRRLARFENLFPVPRGVSYNSYLILDEKTALLDTADASVGAQFLENVISALAGRPLDYLVIDHMEPDHAAMIGEVLLRWPDVQLVCNAKTVPMLRMYFGASSEQEKAIDAALLVKEGDTLLLGAHTLRFVMAPMVHWPEVMMTYEETTGILFSADAFGTFGALDGHIFADELDFAGEWLGDARRYYANIVGKYGAPVQTVLKKASGMDVRMIAPLHGPVWRENLEWFIGKYDQWSRYEPESPAVTILYGSMYGNTASAAQALAERLSARGMTDLAVHDLSGMDVSEAVAECWRASTIVLACPTYNGGLYPVMANLLEDLKALGLQNRRFALIENGSWAPAAARLMTARITELKNCEICGTPLSIRGAMRADQMTELEAMADAITDSLSVDSK